MELLVEKLENIFNQVRVHGFEVQSVEPMLAFTLQGHLYAPNAEYLVAG